MKLMGYYNFFTEKGRGAAETAEIFAKNVASNPFRALEFAANR